MIKIQYARIAAVCVLSLAASGACVQVSSAAKKASVNISGSVSVMETGMVKKFKAKKVNIKGAVTWKSSNKKVLEVSRKGQVKALAAGKATITAKVNGIKASVKVAVYPSLKEIADHNNVYANINAGAYSSVAMKLKADTATAASIIEKQDDGNMVCINQYPELAEVYDKNLYYKYDQETGLVSIVASTPLSSKGERYLYQPFSCEMVEEASQTADTYKITTIADVSKMTETEQKERTGLDKGFYKRTVIVDKETLLLKEYTCVIEFDKEDGGFVHESTQTFTYDQSADDYMPKHVAAVINAENTRTITLIGTNSNGESVTESYTVPDTMPLYMERDATVEFYTDKACTQLHKGPVKNEDGTYAGSTIYVKQVKAE